MSQTHTYDLDIYGIGTARVQCTEQISKPWKVNNEYEEFLDKKESSDVDVNAYIT